MKNCQVCLKEIPDDYGNAYTRKTCSKKCLSLLISKQGKGIKRSDKFKKNLSIKRIAKNNPNWKGNKVKYSGIHAWITRRLPKPKVCAICKKSTPYDLANISQEYKRDLTDWEWLCRKCHMVKDGRINNLKSQLWNAKSVK